MIFRLALCICLCLRVTPAIAMDVEGAIRLAVDTATEMTAPSEEFAANLADAAGIDIFSTGPRLLPVGDLEDPHFSDDATYMKHRNAPGWLPPPLVRCQRFDPSREFWEIDLSFRPVPEGSASALSCTFMFAAASPAAPLDDIKAAFDTVLPGVERSIDGDRIGARVEALPLGGDVTLVLLVASYMELDTGQLWVVSLLAAHTPAGG